MSRAAVATAFLAAVAGLGLVPAANVTEWDGDELAYNDAAVFPSLQVDYLGDAISDEGGVSCVSYEREYVFGVRVSTDTPAAARNLLDALESGMQGPLTGTDRHVRRLGKVLRLAAYLGRTTYGIYFLVTEPFTKTW